MIGEKWTVYWNEFSSDTYLYGSEISYRAKDEVEYVNVLIDRKSTRLNSSHL